MKERPIIFSGAMIRQILTGNKTQTRRVVKPQPIFERGAWSVPGFFCNTESGFKESLLNSSFTCPYGKPGDRLWVRESFRVETDGDGQHISFVADGSGFYDPRISLKWTHEQAVAFGDVVNGPYARPSIHMPRWASRITLEITNVRVERLQDISADDVTAEGVGEAFSKFKTFSVATDRQAWESATVRMFSHLWDKINGKKHPWASNPWVWVVEFKIVREVGDA